MAIRRVAGGAVGEEHRGRRTDGDGGRGADEPGGDQGTCEGRTDEPMNAPQDVPPRSMEAEGFTNYDQEWWHFSYPVEGAVPFDRVIR